jgi:DnaJ-class molecular chaperone
MIIKEAIEKYLNEEDYYKLLGLEKDAKTPDIEKSFRKLSVKWHPDKIKVKDEGLREDACKVFKKLNEAKEVLCDDSKREIYDKYGLDGLKERGNDAHPEHQQEVMQEFMKQMFGNHFNKASTVPDITIVEEVSLEDLWSGKEYKKQIDRHTLCKECNGCGTEDGMEHNCTDCGGSGVQIKVVRMGPMVQQSQQICTLCRGSGSNIKVSKCIKCSGKKLTQEKAEITIKIPKGAYEGIGFSIKNEGNEIPVKDREDGRSRTSVIIKIKEKPHPLYQRGFMIPKYKESKHPKDLKLNLKISLVESLTGFSKSIQTVDGKTINIVHEKIVKNSDVMVLPNKGMPILDKNTIYGHVFVVFDVEYPEDLNANTKRRLWQLLTNTNYKELDNIKDKTILEPADKFRFENIKNPNLHHMGGFPFAGMKIPGMPGFAHFTGNDNDNENESDEPDNEKNGFENAFRTEEDSGQGANCKVQ